MASLVVAASIHYAAEAINAESEIGQGLAERDKLNAMISDIEVHFRRKQLNGAIFEQIRGVNFLVASRGP